MNDKQKLIDWLTEHKISEVEAIIPDQAGIARGKFMPAKTFAAQGGMRLPESVFIQTVTGEHPEETVFSPTDRDMIAVPDLSTIRTVPWANEPTAVVIHDCFLMDETPVDIAPRQVLRKVLDLYRAEGLRPVVAPEIEFYLVKRNTDPDYPLVPPTGRSGRAETVRQPYSLDAIDEFEPLIEDIYDYCEAMDMHVDNLVHEEGTAQLEVNFLHGDALALSDQMFLFKRIVRETAMRHEVYATFMAKPMQNEPGSSMHWHLSLVGAADGNNVFSLPDGGESATFRHFIGGLQTYLPNVALLLAPYVNSYRRFTRYMAAPINLQWGYDNRTVGLRVPETGPQDRRVENRVAGSDVNPYLAIAAALACGYLGIRDGLEPSPPETGNAYRLPFALPRTLNESLELLEGNERMRSLIGERFVQVYAAIKREEQERFFEVISPWEREFLLLNV
ncbi:MAG: glutamine synthetase [Gammaproteobacteria bacterium]|nr:glutamine synthetase [Gammaproteobacteria bacterium]